MSIIARYIVREHVGPFFGSLALIVFIFILNFAFQILGRILGKGLEAGVIIRFFLLNMAWILALAVPMAVLIATLMAFGRLAGDNEITALKASGVRLTRLVRPVLLLVSLLVILLILFNSYALPRFNYEAHQLKKNIYRKQPTLQMEESVFQFDIPDHVFFAREIDHESGDMNQLVIFDESDPKYQSTILATSGQLQFDEQRSEFRLDLNTGEIHRLDLKEISNYAEIEYERAQFRIAAPDMTLRNSQSKYRGDRELTLNEMLDRLELWKTKPERNQRKIRTYLVEIHKKFSIAFACLVFVLIGSALGIRAGMSSIAISSALSIVFFLIYWIFLMSGEDLADRGLLAPWLSMWAPNIVLGSFGIWLVFSTIRESTPFEWLSRFRRRKS